MKVDWPIFAVSTSPGTHQLVERGPGNSCQPDRGRDPHADRLDGQLLEPGKRFLRLTAALLDGLPLAHRFARARTKARSFSMKVANIPGTSSVTDSSRL